MATVLIRGKAMLTRQFQKHEKSQGSKSRKTKDKVNARRIGISSRIEFHRLRSDPPYTSFEVAFIDRVLSDRIVLHNRLHRMLAEILVTPLMSVRFDSNLGSKMRPSILDSGKLYDTSGMSHRLWQLVSLRTFRRQYLHAAQV